MVGDGGVRENRGIRSKRFWSLALAFWIVLGVVCLIAQIWWIATAAAFGVINAVLQLRKAPDKPR